VRGYARTYATWLLVNAGLLVILGVCEWNSDAMRAARAFEQLGAQVTWDGHGPTFAGLSSISGVTFAEDTFDANQRQRIIELLKQHGEVREVTFRVATLSPLELARLRYARPDLEVWHASPAL
jgi:hypothetical protein